MQNYLTKADIELNLARPVGPQDLYKADWTKNYTNDNRYFRANGDWNYASGASLTACNLKCDTDYPDKRSTQNRACKSKCFVASQTSGGTPETSFGSSTNPTKNQPSGSASTSSSVTTSGSNKQTPSKTKTYVFIGIGVVVLGLTTILLLRKSKK